MALAGSFDIRFGQIEKRISAREPIDVVGVVVVAARILMRGRIV
jgi:hypothetical protein